eukprot:TRINITY_DN9991_c0_g1_i1.p1 TRINITY_DN9991_c0_g1~~TRINITY_DN9991_c0_g1_i1.p1  ORF type:complete len:378 (+),score=135.77 TRINITY_DN9991_c0_g1_i1:50-1135(+)
MADGVETRKRKRDGDEQADDAEAESISPLFAKRQKMNVEGGRAPPAPLTGLSTPFKPPSHVYEICERSKGVKVLGMGEVLRGGQLAVTAEPDTPVLAHRDSRQWNGGSMADGASSRGASQNSTESDPYRMMTPAYFTHDAVITPASYQGLAPVPAMSPGESEKQTATSQLLQMYKQLPFLQEGDVDVAEFMTKKCGAAKHDLYHKVIHHAQLSYHNSAPHIALPSNAWVVGGTRGDLRTLREIVDTILPFGEPALCPYNVVVLGDIVGGEPWSLECIMYLLALRLTAPNVIHIVKGPAEDSQRGAADSSLARACAAQFGAERGAAMHATLAALFHALPGTCAIDDSLYVSHAGLPATDAAR